MLRYFRCNSIEEIRALREAHAQFQASLSSAEADFKALAALDQKIKSFDVGSNPYTWFTMEALEDTWRNLQKIIEERDGELAKEAHRQDENDKLRKEFAKHANLFHQWLTETRYFADSFPRIFFFLVIMTTYEEEYRFSSIVLNKSTKSKYYWVQTDHFLNVQIKLIRLYSIEQILYSRVE